MYLQFVKLYNNTKRYCMNTWPAYLHVCVHTYIHTYNIAYLLNKDSFKQDVERKWNTFYCVYAVRSHNRVNMLELYHT